MQSKLTFNAFKDRVQETLQKDFSLKTSDAKLNTRNGRFHRVSITSNYCLKLGLLNEDSCCGFSA